MDLIIASHTLSHGLNTWLKYRIWIIRVQMWVKKHPSTKFVLWGSAIWPFEIPKNLKSWLSEYWILKGWALAMALVPSIGKPEQSESLHFCPNFKWVLKKWNSHVRISDSIKNPDNWQPNLFFTIQNQD